LRVGLGNRSYSQNSGYNTNTYNLLSRCVSAIKLAFNQKSTTLFIFRVYIHTFPVYDKYVKNRSNRHQEPSAAKTCVLKILWLKVKGRAPYCARKSGQPHKAARRQIKYVCMYLPVENIKARFASDTYNILVWSKITTKFKIVATTHQTHFTGSKYIYRKCFYGRGL